VIVIVTLLAAIVFTLSAMHLTWAFGNTWPAKNERELARTVAGFRGIESMPPRGASAAVAVGLGLAGALVLLLADAHAKSATTSAAIAGLAVAILFLGRGIIGFTPSWRRRTPEEPFATLDRHYYSPMCLLVGAGYLALSLAGRA
jgi:hypothetical protein